MNVNPKIKTKVKEAVSVVIQSYDKKSEKYDQNQILVQNQTKNIVTSGVILTKTPDHGSPYYVINYEEGESTIGVTKGTVNNIVKIFDLLIELSNQLILLNLTLFFFKFSSVPKITKFLSFSISITYKGVLFPPIPNPFL